MKIVKITKRDYRDPYSLLERVGAIVENDAFPSRVYWLKSDIKKMERTLYKELKREFPFFSKAKVLSQVGMLMLNLAPSIVKGKGLKVGYMLVDDIGLQADNIRSESELYG